MNRWETVQWETEGHIGRLTLNRPERLNALNPQMFSEIGQLLDELRWNMEVNVLVITGAGRAFCSGVELGSSRSSAEGAVFARARGLDRQHGMIESLYGLPQVTVAMVNGDAVGGGGFGLAMACDMRFAVRTARFWMIPRMVNVVQDFGLTWFLQQACGQPRTMEMVMSGDRITAEQAEAWGFVNRAFSGLDEMRRHVDELAAKVADMQPDVLRMLKHVVRNGATSPLREQLRLESISNALCAQSAESREAMQRYLEQLREKRL